MRHHPLKGSQSFFPAINLDKLWVLVNKQTRTNAAKIKIGATPIIDAVLSSYHKVLRKGGVPKADCMGRAKFFSRRAEETLGIGVVSWWPEATWREVH
jgi:large subunit ribosomal protein L27Ae